MLGVEVWVNMSLEHYHLTTSGIFPLVLVPETQSTNDTSEIFVLQCLHVP